MNATAGPAGSGFAMPRPGQGRGEVNGATGPGDPAGTGAVTPEPLSGEDTVELGEEQQAQCSNQMQFHGASPPPDYGVAVGAFTVKSAVGVMDSLVTLSVT